MKSLTRFYLTSRVTTASTTATISNDNWGNVASYTGESAVLATADLKTFEMVQVNASGGTLTFVKRGLDNGNTLNEVPANKKERGPGTRVYLTQLASNVLDLTSTTTQNFFSNINFSGVYNFSGTQNFSGASTMDTLKINNNLRMPKFADATARDIAIPTPQGDEICNVGGDIQHYNASTVQWETAGSSTPVPNATEAVAGKVKVGTTAEFTAGTDSAGGVYNMPKISDTKNYVDTSIASGNTTIKTYVVGENVGAAALVSLLPDGKVYKTETKKTYDAGTITGQTYTKSCLLNGGAKIATVGIATNTLTLWIGTIDYATHTITYGSGAQVTTNANTSTQQFTIAKAGTDKLIICYMSNTYGTAGRAVTISGTTPTVGNELTIDAGGGGTYPSYPGFSAGYGDGLAAVSVHISTSGATAENVYGLSMSGTTLSKGSAVGGAGRTANTLGCTDLQYVADNLIVWGRGYNVTWYAQLISFSGTTGTAGNNQSIGQGTGPTGKIATNGTDIFILGNIASGNTPYLRKLTYTGTTLSEARNQQLGGSGIVLNGKMIGLVSSTSLIWYSQGATSLTQRNTIDYGVALTNLYENSYSTNYHIFTVSGNPSYVYGITNHTRGIIGYLNSSANYGDSKNIYLNDSIIPGQSSLIPGDVIYGTYATGAIGSTGDFVFGRSASTTEIKSNTTYIA